MTARLSEALRDSPLTALLALLKSFTMSATLTIRNLAEPVKHKLRIQAASHGRSMEAEARAILTEALEGPGPPPPRTKEEMLERLNAISGIWKGKGSTDEMMKDLRGED